MAEATEKSTDKTEGATATHTTPPRKDKHCKVEKCKRPYRAKGYCNVHYSAWRAGEMKKARYKISTKEACRKPRFKGSLCEEHSKAAAAA